MNDIINTDLLALLDNAEELPTAEISAGDRDERMWVPAYGIA